MSLLVVFLLEYFRRHFSILNFPKINERPEGASNTLCTIAGIRKVFKALFVKEENVIRTATCVTAKSSADFLIALRVPCVSALISFYAMSGFSSFTSPAL